MSTTARKAWQSPHPATIIQVFNRYLEAGGEERSVIRIGEDLAAAGHRVVRFWKASAEWQTAEAPPRWKQPWLLWRNRPVLDELRRVHRSESADLWLLHNVIPVVSLGVYRLAKELGVPIIQWLHNYRPISVGASMFAGARPRRPDDAWGNLKECWHGSWRGPWLTSWLAMGYWLLKRRGDYESVRAWVAVSDEMRQVFARAGWFPGRLFSVRHSWHTQLLPPSNQDQGHFLFLGRMIEEKGVRFLVNLWQRPELRNTPLVMAGQGPLVEALRSVSPDQVRWVGHVSGARKQALIAGCRAVLFPCIWSEPLSTVAYEAYEHGKPVLASNLGGMREVVVDGETGRLLEAANSEAWLGAIAELDAHASRRLGLAGRRWLETHVSPDLWNQQFDAIATQVRRWNESGEVARPTGSRDQP